MTPQPPAASQPVREEDAGSAILQAVSNWSEKVQSALRPAYQAPQKKDKTDRSADADAPAADQADAADPASTQTKGVD